MKILTEEEALRKATARCAQTETCAYKMRKMLSGWGLTPEARERCMDYLMREKYIDDERYARAFIHDKVRISKQGRRTIELALWKKGVDRELAKRLLDEVEDQEYADALLPRMKTRWERITGNTERERKMKLIRWADGKGYTYRVIQQCILQMELDMEEWDDADD